MTSDTGKWIIVAGAALLVLGILVYFFHDQLRWIGRLPGDIRVERENFKLYIPITTMVLACVLLTLVIHLIRKLF